MSGMTFTSKSASNELVACVDPLIYEGDFSLDAVTALLQTSDFKAAKLDEAALLALETSVNQARDDGNMDTIESVVGMLENSNITVELDADKMSASITIVANDDGQQPSFANVVKILAKHGVVRGISKKRIQSLLNTALESDAGKEFSDVVAIGLPPRHGKSSRLIPLVPNALDRVLRPQDAGQEKVDMRNLGDILCVSAGQVVAKRVEPTDGRAGYTVTNSVLEAEKGEWQDIKLGNNTKLDENDANLVLAELAGQPKFENGIMNIDDTYVTKGVNVGTGNINYEGAVIVNGDVTENMQIIAKGDVTINGFVESAFIKAGGDIIITQGATGKMNDEDCRLIAGGSVFLQHGQGLDLVVEKDINVKRQLAYSRINCKGCIYIGDPDNPSGNLFASKIVAYNTIKAGSVGAVSGSALEIDYSEGFNLLNQRLEAISELLDSLVSKNADHEVVFSKFNAKKIPRSLRKKYKNLDGTLGKERALLNWLRKIQGDLEQAKVDYELNARIIANKELFPGVTVKLNKRIYRVKKETMKSRILLVDGNWEYQPII